MDLIINDMYLYNYIYQHAALQYIFCNKRVNDLMLWLWGKFYRFNLLASDNYSPGFQLLYSNHKNVIINNN